MGTLGCRDILLDIGALDVDGADADPESDPKIGLLILESYTTPSKGEPVISGDSSGWKDWGAESQSWVPGPFEGPAVEFDDGYPGSWGESRLKYDDVEGSGGSCKPV